MPSEIQEKPLPTPHPDQATTPLRGGMGGSGPEAFESREFDSEDMNFDSCVDDLDKQLSGLDFQPDPALEASDPSGAGKALDPATAEIFEGMRSGSGELLRSRGGWGQFFSHFKARAGRLRSSSSGSHASGDAIEAPHRTGEMRRGMTGSDDDEGHSDIRGLWIPLVLLSYSSAVTLGLAWVLWTGRSIHETDERTRESAPRAEEPRIAKSPDSFAKVELPAIPAENIAGVGQTIRIGDVEITPLSVSFAPAELERKIEPQEYRIEEMNSLILRFKLTNLASDRTFRPLARSLIRDAASSLDRSFIAMPDGGRIELYPLAVESEWLIVGQEFRDLKPGESAETLVTSAPVGEDRLGDEMTWRIRLRTGPYRSDILAVRFKRSELNP